MKEVIWDTKFTIGGHKVKARGYQIYINNTAELITTSYHVWYKNFYVAGSSIESLIETTKGALERI